MHAHRSSADAPQPDAAEVATFVDAFTALAALPVGVLLADAEDCIRWANVTAGELLGAATADLIGQELATLPTKRRLRLSKTTEKIRVVSRSGQARWVECIVQRMGHGPYPTIACLTDVTGYEDRQQVLLAGNAGRGTGHVDSSTGLLTRNALLRELNTQISRSRRYRNPLSLVLLRLVSPPVTAGRVMPFDKHRPARVISRLLRERLRWVDVVGVWAPEEFLLILPETAKDAAQQLVRKIRTHLRNAEDATPGLLGGRSARVALTEWSARDDVNALVGRLRAEIAGADGRPADEPD
jgi:GGDEF domain-containing protein